MQDALKKAAAGSYSGISRRPGFSHARRIKKSLQEWQAFFISSGLFRRLEYAVTDGNADGYNGSHNHQLD
jgi:hypothetical protein